MVKFLGMALVRNFYMLVKLVLISDTYCILMIAIPLLLPHEKGTN